MKASKVRNLRLSALSLAMKNRVFGLVFAVISIPSAWAAPVGLCLHSYSPLAPLDKIECFEYQNSEKIGDDYRFFLHPSGTDFIVPKIRFRSVIRYVDGLNPSDPKFQEALALYEKNAREIPTTRKFLNPRILSMRSLAEVHAKIKKEEESARISKTPMDGNARSGGEKFPELKTLSGKAYRNVIVTGVTPSEIRIMHESGVAGIKLADLSDDLKAIFGYDPKKASEYEMAEAERIEAAAKKDEQARKQAAEAEEKAALCKDALVLIGRINVIAGIVVVDTPPDPDYHPSYTNADSMQSVGGGGNTSDPPKKGTPKMPQRPRIYGSFVVTNAPKLPNLAEGEWMQSNWLVSPTDTTRNLEGRTYEVYRYVGTNK